MTTEIKERIVKYSKELRLPTFRGEFEVHASEAAKQEASYEEYLLGLMEKEYYTRVENRKKSQIRQAGFPQKHYLHDLQKELLPDNARQKLPLLERLDFIKEGRNVVLAGNPGTGKTHIATGLGIKACQHNYKVLFTTVPRLITQLRESHSEHTLRQVEAFVFLFVSAYMKLWAAFLFYPIDNVLLRYWTKKIHLQTTEPCQDYSLEVFFNVSLNTSCFSKSASG
jgi:DNA replication protein DnaC